VGKNKRIEDSLNKDKKERHFRSFPTEQLATDAEMLIDLQSVEEILCKLYLLNPVAVEIYCPKPFYMHSSCENTCGSTLAPTKVFFNFMNIDSRVGFLSGIKVAGYSHLVISDLRKEFKHRKYTEAWAKKNLDTLDYLLLSKPSPHNANQFSQQIRKSKFQCCPKYVHSLIFSPVSNSAMDWQMM